MQLLSHSLNDLIMVWWTEECISKLYTCGWLYRLSVMTTGIQGAVAERCAGRGNNGKIGETPPDYLWRPV